MGKLLFISDLHFGHKNILAFDNRCFPDIESHDRELIRLWNEKVHVDDDVWILGDISWHGVMRTVEILQELNGIKHLCVGNHDKKLLKNSEFRAQFAEIAEYKELEYGDKGIVLCHYPILCYNHHFNGWIHLYGHVHNSFEWNITKRGQYEMRELYNKPCRMYNVGCMIPGMNFTPQTLEEIIQMNEG